MGKFPEIEQDLQMLEQMLINTHDKSLYQRLRLLVLIATDLCARSNRLHNY